MERKRSAEAQALWGAAQRSADRVRGLPTWTQAGIVLSHNFEGGVERPPARE